MEYLKKFLKAVRPALTVTLILMLICGLCYPLFMTGISQMVFPYEANGSLISEDGKIIGSEYVGQEFTEDHFMKGRPSSVHYNTYNKDSRGNNIYSDGTSFAGVSSGCYNYGPSNPELKKRAEGDIEDFLFANPGISKEEIPTDLLTASASGLDPHISPASAKVQLPAISEASGISVEKLEQIVKDNTEKKLLGIFGEETVNVLKVNIDIAKEMKLIK